MPPSRYSLLIKHLSIISVSVFFFKGKQWVNKNSQILFLWTLFYLTDNLIFLIKCWYFKLHLLIGETMILKFYFMFI